MRSTVTATLLLIVWGIAPAFASGNSLSSESSARALGTAGAGRETLSASPIGAFYNPAVAARSHDTALAVSGTYLVGVSDFDVTTNIAGQSIGQEFVPDAMLGAFAFKHSLTSDIAIGFTVGPAFGLAVDYPNAWSASALVTKAELAQLAIAPFLSWRLNESLSLGFAPIMEFGELEYHSNTPFGPIDREYDRSIAFGALIGAHLQLSENTELGLTFRLSADHNYRGRRTGLFPSNSTIDIDSPNILSVGLRRAITPDLSLLASTTWYGWSGTRQQIIVEPSAGNTAIARNWKDGWQFSLGFEYDLSSSISIRSGVSYSTNFIPSSHRVPDAPFDAQRKFGVGLTYHISDDHSLDIAYGHNDLGKNRLDLSAADYGGLSAAGQLDVTGHVFSVQYNTRLNDFLRP